MSNASAGCHMVIFQYLSISEQLQAYSTECGDRIGLEAKGRRHHGGPATNFPQCIHGIPRETRTLPNIVIPGKVPPITICIDKARDEHR